MRAGIKRKIVRIMRMPSDFVTELRYLRASRELKEKLDKNSHGDRAVLIHLYYQDMWPYFSDKINYLMQQGLDLVVILPTKDLISKDILLDYPNAFIISVPNQGRDVLPFLKIAKVLLNAKYKYILKLHSKKSPQRDDGKDWANQMITDLTLSDSNNFQEIERAFTDNGTTAIIGPQGNYVPLTTYYNDNQPKVAWLLTRLYNQKIAAEITGNVPNFGFFAGTMMWLDLNNIKNILDLNLWANNFPSETAQLDGTTAHAIERLLCVVPEYSKMKIYEVGKLGVKNIPYMTDYIPEWSDYHHVKKNS